MSEVDDMATFSCDQGVLRLAYPTGVYRFRWQPRPLAEHRAGRAAWRQAWPDIRVLAPRAELEEMMGQDKELDAKCEAFLAFRREVPSGMARLVEPFLSHQWGPLVGVYEQPAFRELMESNCILGHALANSHELRASGPAAAMQQTLIYSHRKRKQILEFLGYPSTPATERLLRKILPEAAHPRVLNRLRMALKRGPGVAKRLGHIPAINMGVLELAINPALEPLVSSTLLDAVATRSEENARPETAGMLIDGLQLLRQVAPNRRVRAFDTIDVVREFHDRMVEEYQDHVRRRDERIARLQAEAEERAREREQQRERDRERTRVRRKKREKINVTFPPPPIRGTEDITPITTRFDLVAEGKNQHNCLRQGYWETLIMKGKIYIYAIRHPERCTLEIGRGPGGFWNRKQLKGFQNRKPKRTTVKAVDAWLARQSLSV